MNVLIRSRVGRRLLGMFLVLGLPVIAAGWLGIRDATVALRQQTHAALRAAADGAEAQLREFLLHLRRTTEALGTDERICAILRQVGTEPVDMNVILERVWKTLPEAREIFCMNLEGRVVASSVNGLLGQDESQTQEFQRGRESFYPGDIVRDTGAGALRWRMSAPVKDKPSGTILGVIVMGVAPETLTALTTGRRVLQEGADTQSFRIGSTGETYIVNRNGVLITQSRFSTKPILTTTVDTEPVRVSTLKGREMLGDYRDYRGVPVSGASAILRDLRWTLITEIDFSQTFAPIHRLRNILIALALVAGIGAGVAAWHFARAIVDPLRMVENADRALVGKDEGASVVPEGQLPKDEIGDFIRKRNSRVQELIRRQRELSKEQQARAQAAAELEALSYSMVHDMRAPLRTVISMGDLMQLEAGDRLTETEFGYLSRMRAASVRMDQLICDMMRYSSLLRAEVSLSPVSVPDLVRRVIQENSLFLARAADIEIQGFMPLVVGNDALLRQCFAALLDNSLEYARLGVQPKISVRSERKGEWLRIRVNDNGIGMSKEFQNRVFGLFQKGTNSPQGAGLGLALVRVAVKRMGGQVGVISQEGVGSCFWIDLKLADCSGRATNT